MPWSRRPRLGGRVALTTCALVCLLAPGGALAGGGFADRTPLPTSVRTGADAAAKEPSGGGSGGAFVRLIVGLLIVIAVIYGVYWLLKTWNRSKRGDAGDGRLDVVASTTLAPNRSVHLIRVGDELVLVGSAEGSVTPIRVYAPEEARRLQQELDAPELHAVDGAATPSRGRGGRGGRSGRGPTIAQLLDEMRRRTAR